MEEVTTNAIENPKTVWKYTISKMDRLNGKFVLRILKSRVFGM